MGLHHVADVCFLFLSLKHIINMIKTRNFHFSILFLLLLLNMLLLPLFTTLVASEILQTGSSEKRDITYSYSPIPRINRTPRNIHIAYCTSWGMERNYLEVKKFLEIRFPELKGHISGGHYPPPGWAVKMLQVFSYLQVIILIFAVIGDVIWYFLYLNSPPSWYIVCKENKLQLFLFVFLIVPTILQSLLRTGAFEIILDGEIIFSKLSLGNFPTGNELVELFVKAGFMSL